MGSIYDAWRWCFLGIFPARIPQPQRLNTELDLQSLFGLHMCSSTHLLRDPASRPSPPNMGTYTRALLVSQDRRHLGPLEFFHCAWAPLNQWTYFTYILQMSLCEPLPIAQPHLLSQLPCSLMLRPFKGTQTRMRIFWLRFWFFYYFIVV